MTRLAREPSFYPAERHHQDDMIENPDNGYIVVNDLPKVANLKRLFADRFRSEPVLVKRPAWVSRSRSRASPRWRPALP